MDKALVFIDRDPRRDSDKAQGTEKRDCKLEGHACGSRIEAYLVGRQASDKVALSVLLWR